MAQPPSLVRIAERALGGVQHGLRSLPDLRVVESFERRDLVQLCIGGEAATGQAMVQDQPLEEREQLAVEREVAGGVEGLELDAPYLRLDSGQLGEGRVSDEQVGWAGDKHQSCWPMPRSNERTDRETLPELSLEEGGGEREGDQVGT